MAKTSYYTVNGQIIGERTNGVRRNYGVDALGSVTATVQGSAIENTYAYKPYGGQLQKTGASADPAFEWVGKLGYKSTNRVNAEHYVRARTYSSTKARWNMRDRLWPNEPAHNYVAGNPVLTVDPSGNTFCDNSQDENELKGVIYTGPGGVPLQNYNYKKITHGSNCSYRECPHNDWEKVCDIDLVGHLRISGTIGKGKSQLTLQSWDLECDCPKNIIWGALGFGCEVLIDRILGNIGTMLVRHVVHPAIKIDKLPGLTKGSFSGNYIDLEVTSKIRRSIFECRSEEVIVPLLGDPNAPKKQP